MRRIMRQVLDDIAAAREVAVAALDLLRQPAAA